MFIGGGSSDIGWKDPSDPAGNDGHSGPVWSWRLYPDQRNSGNDQFGHKDYPDRKKENSDLKHRGYTEWKFIVVKYKMNGIIPFILYFNKSTFSFFSNE